MNDVDEIIEGIRNRMAGMFSVTVHREELEAIIVEMTRLKQARYFGMDISNDKREPFFCCSGCGKAWSYRVVIDAPIADEKPFND